MERRSEMQRIAVLRETMIRQEVMFKEQVRELHRLYQKQKILMTVVKSAGADDMGTMDLLHSLSNNTNNNNNNNNRGKEAPPGGIRVKRRKMLDLEQLPDENDEDTEYIYDKPRESIPLGLSMENSTLDFREVPTLSLFPIPCNNNNRHIHQANHLDHHLPAMPAQPYNSSTLCEPWWRSLGQDGARLIGQIVRECHQQDRLPTSCPSSYHHPYNQPNALNNLLVRGNNNNNNMNGLLESLQNQTLSYNINNNIPWYYNSMLAPPLLSTPAPRPTTFNGFSLEDNRISWCSGNNFMLPGSNSIKPPAPHALVTPSLPAEREEQVAVEAIKASEDSEQKVETGKGTNDRIVNSRVLGAASCTDTDSSGWPDSDKVVIDLNKNISSTNTGVASDDTLVNKDTITWAATILLSLAPDNSSTSPATLLDSPSTLLSADVKLFKSVVIMLKQSDAKSGKKLLVKSFKHETLLETLKKSVREEGEEEERVVKEEGKKMVKSSNGKKKKKKSLTTWMWGDVTRKKRMQRHRSNHPQQVQQVRCL